MWDGYCFGHADLTPLVRALSSRLSTCPEKGPATAEVNASALCIGLRTLAGQPPVALGAAWRPVGATRRARAVWRCSRSPRPCRRRKLQLPRRASRPIGGAGPTRPCFRCRAGFLAQVDQAVGRRPCSGRTAPVGARAEGRATVGGVGLGECWPAAGSRTLVGHSSDMPAGGPKFTSIFVHSDWTPEGATIPGVGCGAWCHAREILPGVAERRRRRPTGVRRRCYPFRGIAPWVERRVTPTGWVEFRTSFTFSGALTYDRRKALPSGNRSRARSLQHQTSRPVHSSAGGATS